MVQPPDPMNLAYILEQRQSESRITEHAVANVVVAPGEGVLIRSATSSPVVIKIYFAKVRRAIADVVSVKARSIEIAELDQDLNLKYITSRDDFDGFITSSLVLPEPEDTQPEYDSSLGDETIKTTHGYCQLPPQIIVLSIQRSGPASLGRERSLVFTFGYHDRNNRVKFPMHTRALPSIRQNTLGTSMAVDSRGRVLAVAARRSSFILYRLKSWKQIKSEVEVDGSLHESNFVPMTEDRLVDIGHDCEIGAMTFIPPSTKESSLAYLVVSADGAKGLDFYVYKMDCNRPLKGQELRTACHLSKPKSLGPLSSLLLIPLTHQPGIIVVSGAQVLLYPDVIHSEERIIGFLPGDPQVTSEMVHSGSQPLMTAWNRPFRNRYYWDKERKETIYLCREDGLVVQIDLRLNANNASISDGRVIAFPRLRVDTAFTSVVPPKETRYDAFIMGGCESNGALMSIVASGEAKLRAVLACPEPVIDFTSIPEEGHEYHNRSRIFSTAGKDQRHGIVSEVRHGYEIRVVSQIDVLDSSSNVIHLLPFEDKLYAAVIEPGGACKYYRSNDGFKENWASRRPKAVPPRWSSIETSEDLPLDFLIPEDDRTVVIVPVRDGHYIRVGSCVVEAISSNLASKRAIFKHAGIEIMSATINSLTSEVLFLAAIDNVYHLYWTQVEHPDKETLRSEALQSEPTCLHLHTSGSISFATVSTRSGNVDFYRINNDSQLVSCGRFDLGIVDVAAESLLVLNHQTSQYHNAQRFFLLCGLRDGTLKYIELTLQKDEIIGAERDTILLNSTPVRIVPRYSNDSLHDGTISSAIIYSGKDLYSLENNSHGFSESSLKCLWFADHKGQGILQSPILSILTIPPWVNRTLADSNEVYCLTKSSIRSNATADSRIDLRRCRLKVNECPRNIPWQVRVGGQSSRLVWSNFHKRLVVGVNLDRTLGNEMHSFAAIKIIDITVDEPVDEPEEEPFEKDPKDSDIWSTEGLPVDDYFVIIDSGERIASISEWDPILEGNKYHTMIVATNMHPRQGNGNGFIRLYKFRETTTISQEPNVYKLRGVDVRCVAVYDSTSCIVLTTTHLIQLKIKIEVDKDGRRSPHLREHISTPLTSAGSRFIRINHDNQILIGTQEHALQIHQIIDGEFRLIWSGTEGGFSYDATLLPANTHLTIQVRHSPNFSDSDSQLTGHHQPSSRPESGHLKTIFSSTLPATITCLRQTSLRPRLKKDPLLSYPRVLASAINGSFFNIDVLPLPVWRLFRLLQTLIEREQSLCPFLPVKVERFQPLIPDITNPMTRSINGDVLYRLMRFDHSEAIQFVMNLLLQTSILREERDRGLVDTVKVYLIEIDTFRGLKRDINITVASVEVVAEMLIALVRSIVDAP